MGPTAPYESVKTSGTRTLAVRPPRKGPERATLNHETGRPLLLGYRSNHPRMCVTFASS
jgi:hypothetical protein